MNTLSGELLRIITHRLVAEFQPEQVILFGSHAWGEPTADSDVDLMVIVSHSDLSEYQRALRGHACLSGLEIAKDVVVKTRSEFDFFRNVRASLEHRIVEQEGCYMNDAKQTLVQSWLTKAQHDLTAARVLAAQAEPLLDTAVYHCQQAGEKVVKGFLTFCDCEFERIHDVERLVRLAVPYEDRFIEWVEVGRLLTPLRDILPLSGYSD